MKDNLKELVFWLEPTDDARMSGYRGRTQTIWATDEEDGYKKLKAWNAWGLEPKYLYPMEEFKEKCRKQDAIEAQWKKAQENAPKAKVIEVENV